VILSNGTVKSIVEAIFQEWNGFHYDDDISVNNTEDDNNKEEDDGDAALAEDTRTTAVINATRADLKRRRYTVYLSDLEKTVVYALTHEVAQHRTPTGEQLAALFDFVKALVDFFPPDSVLLPYLKSLLSVKSRISRG
jgi:transglutaminase-like putative cysteine protease